MLRKTLEEKISKAKEIHGDKYNYDKATDPYCTAKVIITCPVHGDFMMTWNSHINGKCGCPKCNKCYKWTNEEWIEEVSKRFNNKYDYSKTVYTKAKEMVTVICRELDEFGEEHGEFQIRAGNHMAGIGCPKCGGKYSPTTEEWVRRAKKVHGGKYDYSKTVYTGNNKKVTITCPEHGDFSQAPFSHLIGCGCPKCKGGVSSDKGEFVKKAQGIHKPSYDYSKFDYVNARTKGIIICKRHGEFFQSPYQHLLGQGCPKCKTSRLENMVINLFDKENVYYVCQYKVEANGKALRCDFYLPEYNIIIECQGEQHYIPTSFCVSEERKDVFLDLFKKLQENDKDKYEQCTKNGFKVVYFTMPSTFHAKGIDVHEGFYGDKTTFTSTSDLMGYIRSNAKKDVGSSFVSFYNDIRGILSKEAINNGSIIRYNNFIIIYKDLTPNKRDELNGLRRMYMKRGNDVLVVFEDEYVHNRDIVLSKIRHITKMDGGKRRIHARKCMVKEIHNELAKQFLAKNHIQGYVPSTVYLGAFHDDELIGVMTFRKEASNGGKWELTRFASDNKCVCSGLGGKLFKHFIRNYGYTEIKSFADRRWTCNEDNVYTKLGFRKSDVLKPEYRYIDTKEKTRCHKFGFRKRLLMSKFPNEGLSMGMTEAEMTEKLGFYRIWDCGLVKYVYHKN